MASKYLFSFLDFNYLISAVIVGGLVVTLLYVSVLLRSRKPRRTVIQKNDSFSEDQIIKEGICHISFMRKGYRGGDHNVILYTTGLYCKIKDLRDDYIFKISKENILEVGAHLERTMTLKQLRYVGAATFGSPFSEVKFWLYIKFKDDDQKIKFLFFGFYNQVVQKEWLNSFSQIGVTVVC